MVADVPEVLVLARGALSILLLTAHVASLAMGIRTTPKIAATY